MTKVTITKEQLEQLQNATAQMNIVLRALSVGQAEIAPAQPYKKRKRVMTKKSYRVLNLLKKSERGYTTDQLGILTGCSREYLWTLIHDLRENDYPIVSVKRPGEPKVYRFEEQHYGS